MLADEDKEVRRRAINKILTLKGYAAARQDIEIEDYDFKVGIVKDDEEDTEDNGESYNPPTNKNVRICKKPKINFESNKLSQNDAIITVANNSSHFTKIRR